MAEPFIGEIRIVGFTFAPEGWALCNGQLLAIAQYSALFNLLGTTYGGDGETTFALPNLQGRVPIHTGSGVSSYFVQGQTGGVESVALSLAQLPAHSHSLDAATTVATTVSAASNSLAEPARPAYDSAGPSSPMNSLSIGLSGGGATHENRQPFLVVNFIISLEGIFPSPG